MSEERTCNFCDKPLRQKNGESNTSFCNRDYCGQRCKSSARFMRKIRYCAMPDCRKELTKRDDEAFCQYKLRRYCDKACASRHQMSKRKTSNEQPTVRRGLCPEGHETPKEIARVQRRIAIMQKRKQAELDAQIPRDEDGREIPAAVEITVVPIRCLIENPTWGWEG